ncbi:MAG: hypothetical protein ABEJ03_01810 [Candidatus Nanohaloarchaea archaeon]
MGLDEMIEKYVRSNALNYGRGRFDLLGLDGVVVPAKTWVSVFERFEAADPLEVMFDVGREHGRLGVEEVGRSNGVSRSEFVDKVMETANLMGMGVVEVEFFDPGKEVLVVSIASSPLNSHFTGSDVFSSIDSPVHQFWRGVYHSVAEEMFDSAVESEEVSCEFLGDEECVIKCFGAE